MTALTLTLSNTARRVARIDRVWLLLLLGFSGGAVLLPEQTSRSLAFVAESLLHVAPYLALAVAVAAGASASGADKLVAHAFRGRGLGAVAVAALFGALSPFCSCGVIPVIAALLAMGVPLAPVMAFWLASPIMDPEIFVLTAGPLGLDFAVAKTLAAVFMGLLGGGATWAVMRAGGFKDSLRAEVTCCGGCGAPKLADPAEVRWRFWHELERRRRFWRQCLATLGFLGKWLTLAFVLESLMLAYVPAETVGAVLGGDGPLAVPLAVAVGMPAYMNGYAAIPVVAGLLELGMQPGAAMAFMVAGGVSSIPAAIAVYALVKPPVFLWYLALAMFGALLVGYAYGLVA
jgi:uncharacterized protein